MKRLPLYLAHAVFHLFGAATVVGLSFLATAGTTHSRILMGSTQLTGFEFQWEKLAIQAGLAVCVWAFGYISYRYVRLAIEKRKHVAVMRPTGTAMTEFLIVLVPYILLTSGLAQLSQLNITSMLADVAIYDAARTVWLWAPEEQMARQGRASGCATSCGIDDSYQNAGVGLQARGRATAAMMLAPTAPGDFIVGQPYYSPLALADPRSVVAGMFGPGDATTNWQNTSAGAALASGGTFGLASKQAVGSDVAFWRAFDSTSFRHRAGRKPTFAQFAMSEGGGSFEVINGGRVGARFTYMYNVAFPWFGYIWGTNVTIASRQGWYTPIRREHTFVAHPDMS